MTRRGKKETKRRKKGETRKKREAKKHRAAMAAWSHRYPAELHDFRSTIPTYRLFQTPSSFFYLPSTLWKFITVHCVSNAWDNKIVGL